MRKNHIIRNPFNSGSWSLIVEVMKMRKTTYFMAVIFGYSTSAFIYSGTRLFGPAVSTFVVSTFLASPMFLVVAANAASLFKRFDLRFAILNWVLLFFSAFTACSVFAR